jgi:hypothetical protein
MLYISEAREFLVLRRAGCSFAQLLDTTAWHGMTAERYHTWRTKCTFGTCSNAGRHEVFADQNHVVIEVLAATSEFLAGKTAEWGRSLVQASRSSLSSDQIKERYEHRQNMPIIPFKFGRVILRGTQRNRGIIRFSYTHLRFLSKRCHALQSLHSASHRISHAVKPC